MSDGDRIDKLVTELGNAAVKVNEISKSISTLAATMEVGFQGVSEAFSHQARYTELAFDTLNPKIDTLNAKVDTLDKKVDALDEKVGGLDEKVDALDKKASGLETKVDEGFVRVEANVARVEGTMKGGFVRVEEKLNQLLAGRE